jgi:hypothetical protein
MSNMINFIIGNHSPYLATEDAFEYVVAGVRSVGGLISYSIDDYATEGVNIIMERRTVEQAKNLVSLRQRFPKSKLYVIATEILTGTGFNSANTVHTDDGSHYSNAPYWAERTNGFLTLVPCIDGLIFLAESLFEGYRRLNLPSYYLPLVALPDYPILGRLPVELRDIDVFFSGAMTEYRAHVMETLREEGLRVFSQLAKTPSYLRNHFLARSKFAIGLRLGPDTQFTSKQRAHYYLLNRIPHLFESTPDHTDLHPYIEFAAPGDEFVERCFEFLNGVRVFPEHVFDDFRHNPQFDHVSVFRGFLQFLRSR